MKLYNSFGMNPRIVRMFLLEKGLSLNTEDLDLFGAENRQQPYLSKNPAGQTPALELDDGSVLSETSAICEYLEEANPSHPLIGATAKERAETRMWLRRVEINICHPMVQGFYYSEGYELFKDRLRCLPEAAEGMKAKARDGMAWLEAQLQDGKWICGDRFTLADICLYTYIDLLAPTGQGIPDNLPKLRAWFSRVSARESAETSLFPGGPEGLRG